MTTFEERFADAAITARKAERAKRALLTDLLKLGNNPGERLGEVITLAPAVHVAEILGGPFGGVWREIVDNKPTTNAHLDRWHAILGATAARHGTDGGAAAYYAGRVLGLPDAE